MREPPFAAGKYIARGKNCASSFPFETRKVILACYDEMERSWSRRHDSSICRATRVPPRAPQVEDVRSGRRFSSKVFPRDCSFAGASSERLRNETRGLSIVSRGPGSIFFISTDWSLDPSTTKKCPSNRTTCNFSRALTHSNSQLIAAKKRTKTEKTLDKQRLRAIKFYHVTLLLFSSTISARSVDGYGTRFSPT